MATTFNLDIRFTGICAFVPNLDSGGKYSLCVVMPSSDQARRSIDGEILCPHEASVRFYAAEPPPPPFPGPGPLAEVPLKNCRVALEVSGGSGRPVLPPKPPYLLDLPDLFGTYAVIDPSIVDSNPPPPVMVQVLLGDGKVGYIPDDTAMWNIGKLDGGTPRDNLTLVHEVVLSLSSVTSARLVGSTFTGTPIDIDLDPTKVPGAAFVRIVNVCDLPSKQEDRDRDFKWYYELLTDGAKQAIADELKRNKEDLPIPRRIPLIGGQDCFPGKMPAVTFGS